MSKELIELTGAILEVCPINTFRVKIDDMEHIMLCYLGGRLKQHKIKVILGDRVRVETSPYDLNKGRVTYRL